MKNRCAILLFLSLIFSHQPSLASGKYADSFVCETVAPRSPIDRTYESFRANAPFFWSLARKRAESFFLKESLLETIGAGDAHLYNFDLLNPSDNKSLRLSDWDDSGRVPALLDLARLAISSRLINRQIHFEELLDIYIANLGSEMNSTRVPSVREYDAKKFKKADSLEDAPSKESDFLKTHLSDFLAAVREKGSHEFRYYEKNSGGSQGIPRFLVEVKNKEGSHFFEFKEQVLAAASYWKVQEAPFTRLNSALSAFGPYLESDVKAVEIGSRTFMVRPLLKKQGFTAEDYDQHSPSELKERALLVAAYVAQVHSKNMAWTTFKKNLLKSKVSALAGLKKFEKAYFEELLK